MAEINFGNFPQPSTGGGIEAIGSIARDEARFLKYLASRYRSWVTAMGYRAIYFLQLQNSPLWREWVEAGRPETGEQFSDAFRRQDPVAQQTEGDATTDVVEIEETEPTEFEILKASARELSTATGRDFEDVLAELSGLSTTGADTGITEFQRGQLEIQQGQLGIQRAQLGQNQANTMNERLIANRLAQFNIGQQELIRQSARSGRTGREFDEAVRAESERKFEEFRDSISNTPRNFFQRQMLQNTPNPFLRDDPGAIEEALFTQEAIQREIDFQDAILKNTSGLIKDIEARTADGEDTGLTSAGIANPSTDEEFRASEIFGIRSNAQAEKDRLSGKLLDEQVRLGQTEEGELVRGGGKRSLGSVPIREEPFTNGGGTIGRTIGRQSLGTTEGSDAPPRAPVDLRLDIPSALRPFVSGGAARLSREALLSREFVTPSAQQFGRLGFESREQFRGLSDIRGRDEFAGILSSIEQSLPTPTRGARRRAARQRV